MLSLWRKWLWQGESSYNSDSGQIQTDAPAVRPTSSQHSAQRVINTPDFALPSCQSLRLAVNLPASYGLFRHEPLDLSKNSFRLLDINGVSSDGLIECTMSHYNRDGLHQSYRALSYEWGPATPTEWILLNGKAFRVRKNLFSFLRSTYEHPAAREMIWIDAICIDQDNMDEKNHQVKQMADIYRNSATVYGWLGGGPREYGYTSALLRVDLPESLYWTRMWIVQEITLAQDVVLLYGNRSFSWDEFKESLLRTYDYKSSVSVDRDMPALRVVKLADLLRSKSRPLTVLTLLRELHGGGLCADVRDRVYALLGMASDTRSLEPDYTITPGELLYRVLQSEYPMAEANTVTIDDVTFLCKALQVDFEDLRASTDTRTGSGQVGEQFWFNVGSLEIYRLCEHLHWPLDFDMESGNHHNLNARNGFTDLLDPMFSFIDEHFSMKRKKAVILRRTSIGPYSCIAMAEYEDFEKEMFPTQDGVVKCKIQCHFYDSPALQNAPSMKLRVKDDSISLPAKAVFQLTKLVGTPPFGDARNITSGFRFLWVMSGNGLVDDLIRIGRRKCFRVEVVEQPGDRIPLEVITDDFFSGYRCRTYDGRKAFLTPFQFHWEYSRAKQGVLPHSEVDGLHPDDGNPMWGQTSQVSLEMNSTLPNHIQPCTAA